jgi:hypothetical protein
MTSLLFSTMITSDQERETERIRGKIDQTDVYRVIAITTKTIKHFFTRPHARTIDDPDDFDRVNCLDCMFISQSSFIHY